MENIMSLSSVIDKLYEEAVRNRVFWHYCLPCNYQTGKLYSGLNFLILGVRNSSLSDPRWGTVQDFSSRDFVVNADAKDVVNILHWDTEQLSKNALYPIPVFNVIETNDYSSFYKEVLGFTLFDLLDKYHIPFIESEVDSYSPLENLLYLNTIEKPVKNQSVKMAISSLSKWLINNVEWQHLYRIGQKLDQIALPKYMLILEDLAMFKIAYQIDVNLKKCIDIDDLCDAIKFFYETNRKTLLLSVFLVADYVVKMIFERSEKADEIFRDFLLPDHVNELMHCSKQEIKHIRQAMEECQQAVNDDVAYLHFYNYDDESSAEFYVTSYNEDLDKPIKGVMVMPGFEPIKCQYTTAGLCREMFLETSFQKVELNQLKLATTN